MIQSFFDDTTLAMTKGVIGLLLLLLCISSALGIIIKTVDLEEIYSGPEGVPLPGWDSPVDPNTFERYQSVAEVRSPGT